MRKITLCVLALAALGLVGCTSNYSSPKETTHRGTKWEYANLHYAFDFPNKKETWVFNGPGKRLTEDSAAALYADLGNKAPLAKELESRCALLNAVGSDGWELISHEQSEIQKPNLNIHYTIEDWSFKRSGN
jgi:hypothetical protein